MHSFHTTSKDSSVPLVSSSILSLLTSILILLLLPLAPSPLTKNLFYFLFPGRSIQLPLSTLLFASLDCSMIINYTKAMLYPTTIRHLHSSFINYIWKQKTVCMSCSQRLDKENVVCLHSGVLLNHFLKRHHETYGQMN